MNCVFKGRAGAPQSGQWWDQQAGAAAGCECSLSLTINKRTVSLTSPFMIKNSTVSVIVMSFVIDSIKVFYLVYFVLLLKKFWFPLQDARSSYRKILTDSARKLNAQNAKLGACIEKARPYYEARRLAKEVCICHSYHCFKNISPSLHCFSAPRSKPYLTSQCVPPPAHAMLCPYWLELTFSIVNHWDMILVQKQKHLKYHNIGKDNTVLHINVKAYI